MSSYRRLSLGPSAALMLALCAGCDAPPREQGAPSANGITVRPRAQQALQVDRQAPGSENRVPYMAGSHGRLGYRPGCLFLVGGGGGEMGLVVPSYARFDGKRLIGNLKKPTGEPFAVEIGQFVHLTGYKIDNPRDGRYSCDTKQVLITDYF